MPIPIFSYDRLKTDTDFLINIDADTDMVLADTDMIETDTDISVSAKNISQQIYWSISNKNRQTKFRLEVGAPQLKSLTSSAYHIITSIHALTFYIRSG